MIGKKKSGPLVSGVSEKDATLAAGNRKNRLSGDSLRQVKQGDKGWQHLEIVEGDDARPMADVLECNTEEGYCIRFKRDADGNYVLREGVHVTERVEGDFIIRKAAR